MLARVLGLALIVLLLPAGCAASGAVSGYNYAHENDPRQYPYVIGVADNLTITVWKQPDLSSKVTVRPDGTITMPLIGDIQAAGHTADELKGTVLERLGRYVKDPVVTVAVTDVNSYHFTVEGSVTHPGVFTSKYYVTFSQAVALAGGPDRFADPDEAVIVRRDAVGKARRIPINYEKILSGERPDEDLVVLSGDTVIVP